MGWGGGGYQTGLGREQQPADRFVGEMLRILYAAVNGDSHPETGGPARLPVKCPGCKAMGTQKIVKVYDEEKIFCTGLTRAAKKG